MGMSRDNYILGLATGRIPMEACKIELTEDEKEELEALKKEIAEDKANGYNYIYEVPQNWD
ncbi:hypothetical protein [Peptoniphilus indolicus]|uniref:Uncharacterized protein n=2 Tax=Peptoniphilus indolicus TaxID=33030 RepID=G4D3K3_9FIRM|nr:hypothetical protein [Peptoniphilus indolicus]EGY79893.1 hypothetical protein HMPREF9129_0983 [Peptoniphilus indolicus ATCC 29427]SUB75681.1 Uncharacterised protein [Peptoniphilus indolicus]